MFNYCHYILLTGEVKKNMYNFGNQSLYVYQQHPLKISGSSSARSLTDEDLQNLKSASSRILHEGLYSNPYDHIWASTRASQ